MEESRQRIQQNRRPTQPVVVPPEAPELTVVSAPKEPLKNCATCALYPCGLWKERPVATILRTGQPFNFQVLSAVPMLCGGAYWEQKVLSAWERNRRQAGPTGLTQFTKRNEEDQ